MFFREQFARMLAHDPGVRLGEDPEELHQLRVATRRLRSVLRTATPLLEATWAQALRDELSWLGDELGCSGTSTCSPSISARRPPSSIRPTVAR